MTKQELETAIIKVSKATNKTFQEVADLLEKKDSWTWFLIRQA